MLSMLQIGPVCAADNHGADAHSPSMSVESGEEPIPDESVTEPGGGSGNEADDLELEDAMTNEEADASDEEGGFEIPFWIYIAGGAVIVAVIVASVSKTKKKAKAKKKYESKH